ncbi:MAG: iron-containing alcohol dehydrogenase [Acidobacteria bacterium]|nr:MAG: iron-containing alcohol dehydrogenase [Acidobacteriota bacterium]
MFDEAENLLREFKNNQYLHGLGVLTQLGDAAARLGKKAVWVRDRFPGAEPFIEEIRRSLEKANVTIVAETSGAAANAPREDLQRITDDVKAAEPEIVISFGGGSTIDATKAAVVLAGLGGGIDDYFGTGLVTEAAKRAGRTLTSHVAIQTAASSGAHLTKYSNITDLRTSQKKLIVDEAVVPSLPVFDYRVTLSCPWDLTVDGALDGISHCLEVLYSAVGKPNYERAAKIAETAIELILAFLPKLARGEDAERAREALGLATDLGGYAIMVGGTNGAHLTSFSLVDILSHGRACGLMNPYYTVLFASALEAPLRMVGRIYHRYGYTSCEIDRLSGRELGIAVAEAMIAFGRSVGLPTALGQVSGFSNAHIVRALSAAKTPQLRMKLENMPVPMRAEQVDEYMGSVLEAARQGDLALVKSLEG